MAWPTVLISSASWSGISMLNSSSMARTTSTTSKLSKPKSDANDDSGVTEADSATYSTLQLVKKNTLGKVTQKPRALHNRRIRMGFEKQNKRGETTRLVSRFFFSDRVNKFVTWCISAEIQNFQCDYCILIII